MPLTDKQKEYLRCCNRRWNVKTGATGSGKSFVDYSVVIPQRITRSRGEGLLVLMGNTRGTLERNILSPMRDIWPGLVGRIRADNTVDVFGKRIYALGADNKKHVARIQGATIEYCYGDEITTWTQDVFEMLKSRLRCRHSHFDGTCNPAGPRHWFKEFMDSDADSFQQSYRIDDNPYLPEEFVQNLKQEYAGSVYYDRYILGLWTAAEGVIYRQFADAPDRFIIDTLPDNEQPTYCTVGVDFGGNGSATTFNLTGFTTGYKKVITLAEHYKKAIISPAQLEQDFVDFIQEQKARGYKIYTAYCDSAEQTLIEGLRVVALRARLGVEVVNARKGPINDRIRFYCAMMGRDRYKIMRRCTHTIEALQSAVWDPRSVTQDRRLDDGKMNVDSLDAMEYAAEPFMSDILALR